MATGYVHESTMLSSKCLDIAARACHKVRFAPFMDPLRFGLTTGEIPLESLLNQSYERRKSIVEIRPFIDMYLGSTRVYKRVSKAMLFAFCPDIGRFLQPIGKSFIVRLPEGFSNVLSVKLAVHYMEEYVLHPRMRQVDWKVSGDLASYIYVAEVLGCIGVPTVHKLEAAIFRRIRERPLRIEEIRAIWSRENPKAPSKYAYALAAHIVTFMCVPKIEKVILEYDIDSGETYAQRKTRKIQALAARYPGRRRLARYKAQQTTNLLEQLLEHDANFVLKQLVYTSSTFRVPDTPSDPDEYVAIKTEMGKVAAIPHLVATKKVALMRKGDVDKEDV